jgi:hypothetical protein
VKYFITLWNDFRQGVVAVFVVVAVVVAIAFL